MIRSCHIISRESLNMFYNNLKYLYYLYLSFEVYSKYGHIGIHVLISHDLRTKIVFWVYGIYPRIPSNTQLIT